MKDVNEVTLIGHAGRAPEQRFTQGGALVIQFSFATTARWKDEKSQPQERTEWHNITAYRKTAELMRDMVQKGAALYVKGSLHTEQWIDKKTQQTKRRTEIVVRDFSLLDKKPIPISEPSDAIQDDGPEQLADPEGESIPF